MAFPKARARVRKAAARVRYWRRHWRHAPKNTAERVRAYRMLVRRKREAAKAERDLARLGARPDPLRVRAFHEAERLVGVMEQGGNNRGSAVEALIRQGGGLRGQAWCGWFCAAVYKRAGSKAVTWRWGAVRLYLPGTGIARTGDPRKGDLVRFTFSHIGLFDCWCNAAGKAVPRAVATHVRTIEGNTGATGAVSDSKTGGDGVYRKVRGRGLVSDYLRVSR